MGKIRIGVIGARRHLQGIGEFVARDLHALGAEVCAIVGTTPETVASAQEMLRSRYGIETNGYLETREMFAQERLDAVAICSPYVCHGDQLAAALEANVHVLCEKPFMFEREREPQAAEKNLEEVQRLLEGFAERGKVVMANEQWPYTLKYFDQLYPEGRIFSTLARSLSFTFCPGSAGLRMIPEAVPHVLSVLGALTPSGGDIRQVRVMVSEEHAEMPRAISLAFDYVHSAGHSHVSCYFRQVQTQPRPAGYAINRRGVRRLVSLPVYEQYFETCDEPTSADSLVSAAVTATFERRIPIEDPLKLLIEDFLQRIANAQKPLSPEMGILDRLRLLWAIYQACRPVL